MTDVPLKLIGPTSFTERQRLAGNQCQLDLTIKQQRSPWKRAPGAENGEEIAEIGKRRCRFRHKRSGFLCLFLLVPRECFYCYGVYEGRNPCYKAMQSNVSHRFRHKLIQGPDSDLTDYLIGFFHVQNKMGSLNTLF